MKIYAINLASQTEKKNYIINECKKLNLDIDIFDGVYGAELSEEYLKSNVLDYPNCYLTRGEIGCALSHIKIYEDIIKNNLPYAMILEDDAVLSSQLPNFIADFEKFNTKEGIFLLIDDFKYIVNKKIKIGSFDIYPVESATTTTGYILTLEAAKSMVKFLYPIRYEADMFKIFKMCTGTKIYATVPHLVSSNDKDKSNSSIEDDRKLVAEKRKAYRNNLFKNYEKRKRFKRFLWRIFIKPKQTIQVYKS